MMICLLTEWKIQKVVVRTMAGTAQTVRLDPQIGVSARAKSNLAPTAIQSLEVLSLPVTSLTTYINSMVEQNPLLELDFEKEMLEFEQLPTASTEEDGVGQNDEFNEECHDRFALQSLGETRPFDLDCLQEGRVDVDTLQSYLHIQAAQFTYSKAQESVLDSIIESIDDNGYFQGSLALLCEQENLDIIVGEAVLSDVQSLLPRGVGARTLNECLVLQLDPDYEHYHCLKEIVLSRLDDIAYNRLSKLAKDYKLPLETLYEIRRLITCLDPRPGSAFALQAKTVYIVPDLYIKKEGNNFSVQVVGQDIGSVVLNNDYMNMLRGGKSDEATRKWLETKHNQALLLLKSIHQRKQTLYRFGNLLVEAQYEFFCYGEARLRPLTMQQAADALGLHVSTVSRTVQGKHALTPWGVFPLKFFFCSALGCTQPDRKTTISSRAIKDRIKHLIQKENPSKPMSDNSITLLLNEEGVDIKRRTVAKYREALGIGCRTKRRQEAMRSTR